MKQSGDKLTFFRQSGWLVIATVTSGLFMTAVHAVVSKPMRSSEYALFCALLRVYLLMGFPAAGLQVVFAQQAAAAISEPEEKRLSQTTRAVLRATFLIWLGLAGLVFVGQSRIEEVLKIANPVALWMTLLLGLASLWQPVFRGLLQGRQNFAGLGWVLILDGVGRFTAIVLIVQLGGQAAGGMAGAFIGQVVSLCVAGWLVRSIITGPGAPFSWQPWLRRVIPLTLGVGVILFLNSTDVVYVQSIFSKDETFFYIPAAMIGLALVTFTTPLASVMFPKIVHSAARTQRTDALQQALVSTAVLGALAATASTLLPELPLRIVYPRTPLYWKSAPLVPWFAWALLPLVLANVLLSNLLARERFRVVPWAVIIALAYGGTLLAIKDRVVLFSPADFRDLASLVRRVQAHSDPAAELVWSQLPAQAREQLAANHPSAKALAKAMNEIVRSGPAPGAIVTPQTKLSGSTEALLAEHPTGKELVRLNRLLLHDAFSQELVSSQAKRFRGFKLVIGTLGVFSSLLLALALSHSFRPCQPIGSRARTDANGISVSDR